MKFLSVRDLKTKSSQVWKELAGQKEMIVTSNGRPIALLSSINENNLEQVLAAFRRARATNAVASIQYESTQKGTDKITMDEINAEIEAVRSIKQYGHFTSSSPLKNRLPDPDDESFLEVATAGRVRSLVTGNTAHYPSPLWEGIDIFSPSEFIEFYRKQNRSTEPVA